MLLEALVVEQHIIEGPSQLTAIATADGVVTAGTADRTGIEEVSITIVTEIGTELRLPLQTLQRLPNLTEVNLGIEATQQAIVLAVIGRLRPLVDD